jgi:amphi-Trp domain-containing protein
MGKTARYTSVDEQFSHMGELETEEQKTRTEVATYLRGLADQLDDGDAVSLELGGRRVSLDPVDPITFKLEGESDWSEGDSQAKQSIEFELVWWTDAQSADEGSLTVEGTQS